MISWIRSALASAMLPVALSAGMLVSACGPGSGAAKDSAAAIQAEAGSAAAIQAEEGSTAVIQAEGPGQKREVRLRPGQKQELRMGITVWRLTAGRMGQKETMRT